MGLPAISSYGGAAPSLSPDLLRRSVDAPSSRDASHLCRCRTVGTGTPRCIWLNPSSPLPPSVVPYAIRIGNSRMKSKIGLKIPRDV